MSESINLCSVTTLLKDAMGTSRGIVIHGQEAVAGAGFDHPNILRAYKEEDDRDGYIKWAIDQQFAGLQSAANRGTEIHAVAEALHLGQQIEYDPFLEPWIVQYRRFLEEFQPEFLMTEAPVYNLTVGYAGTLDAIAVIQGTSVVLDIKTTAHGPDAKTKSGKPKSRPPFPEVALQLVLYRRAELVGLLADRQEINYRRYYTFNPESHTEPMPSTGGGVCVVVSPEDYLVVPVDTDERVWKAAQHAIEVALFQTETSKAVFGPLLRQESLL